MNPETMPLHVTLDKLSDEELAVVAAVGKGNEHGIDPDEARQEASRRAQSNLNKIG